MLLHLETTWSLLASLYKHLFSIRRVVHPHVESNYAKLHASITIRRLQHSQPSKIPKISRHLANYLQLRFWWWILNYWIIAGDDHLASCHVFFQFIQIILSNNNNKIYFLFYQYWIASSFLQWFYLGIWGF